jgi:hypothetical protein
VTADLLVTVFGEMHSAGHYLWHRSPQGHPLYKGGSRDSLLETYRAVDRAIERICAGAPPETYFAIFAAHGMESNSMDLTGMAFLPEVLYRMSFPGRRAIGGQSRDGGAGTFPRLGSGSVSTRRI